MKYVDFNDTKIPIGKRKQAYLKWAMLKGTSEMEAKKQANKKFGFEQKECLLAIVQDYGDRMLQRSFRESEIFDGHDLRKYKKTKWIEEWDEGKIKELKKKARGEGWDVIIVGLVP